MNTTEAIVVRGYECCINFRDATDVRHCSAKVGLCYPPFRVRIGIMAVNRDTVDPRYTSAFSVF